jgi:hypothetical protein
MTTTADLSALLDALVAHERFQHRARGEGRGARRAREGAPMTPTDLLDLRRRVARVLSAKALPEYRPPTGPNWRPCCVLWEPGPVEPLEWLPVLDDDGTIGVLLGELVRRGCYVRRLSVLPLASAIIVETVDGREVAGRADHIGHALAAALVAVAGGAS